MRLIDRVDRLLRWQGICGDYLVSTEAIALAAKIEQKLRSAKKIPCNKIPPPNKSIARLF
jgi:hypothetical protein